MPGMQMLRISGWNEIYENNRTRELQRMDWVPVSNHHDTHGFTSLMAQPHGTALYGAWMLILQVASKCKPRGVLCRAPGIPHTAETIAQITRSEEKLIQRAIEFLTRSEIGWIETIAISEIVLNTPPARLSPAETKQRAHGRLDRALRSGSGVNTPLGHVTERPVTCQWCALSPGSDAKGVTNIRGHHFLPYGSPDFDRTVIFLCRSCHSLFESGKYTTSMICEQYSDWSRDYLGYTIQPHGTAGDPQVTAGDPQGPAVLTRARGTEWKGMEWKGTEERRSASVEAAETPAPKLPPLKNTQSQPIKTEAEGITWVRESLVNYARYSSTENRPPFDTPPDDELCRKVIAAGNGASLALIGETLKEMHERGKYPELSWGWFPDVIGKILNPPRLRRAGEDSSVLREFAAPGGGGLTNGGDGLESKGG